jgi:5-methyltetrahydrofolate--homocysteine methyltransferase
MERTGDGGKGRIVLATVKGDVHDIGKNLVDIILTNNGYEVVNLGIKQPVQSIIEAAEQQGADAIGMSGLLVKSTLVMRENLEELNRRDLHGYPVLLGGAALTRPYVDHDLREVYRGDVYYCKDAFEGLRTMDAIMVHKRGGEAPVVKRARPRVAAAAAVATEERPVRSAVATDVAVPSPPFWGTRVVKGIPVADIARYVNTVTLYRGQWGYKRRKGQSIEEYQQFLDTEVQGIFRDWLARCIEQQLLQPAVVYGYFRCASDGDDLIVYGDGEPVRFTFPRQPTERRLCIADFFRPVGSEEPDVVGFHIVTMGRKVSEEAQRLFTSDRYTDYLHLHGLGVEMAEALAELWHQRIRDELGIAGSDAGSVDALFEQSYRGSRYSFGYPACPNLEDHVQLFELLQPERIGVELSEEFQLVPEQSTSAIIVHHPEAKYFTIPRG